MRCIHGEMQKPVQTSKQVGQQDIDGIHKKQRCKVANEEEQNLK